MVSFGVVGIFLTLTIFVLQVNSILHIVKENEQFAIICPTSPEGILLTRATWRYERTIGNNVVRAFSYLYKPFSGVGTWDVSDKLKDKCQNLQQCTFIPTGKMLGKHRYEMILEVEYTCWRTGSNPTPQLPKPMPQQPYPTPQQPYPIPQQPYPAPQRPYPTPQQPYPTP